jgi:hypothetical protein
MNSSGRPGGRPALQGPALRAGQGKKKFLIYFQGRAGQDRTGQKAGQGEKKCPVTVSDLYFFMYCYGVKMALYM